MLLKALITVFSVAGAAGAHTFQSRLETGLKSLLKNPEQADLSIFPEELNVLLPYARHLNLKATKKLTTEARGLLCTACIAGVEVLVDAVLLGADIETIEKAALVFCDIFNIEDHDVCRGAIANYAPQLINIIDLRRVTGQEACAIILNDGCGASDKVNGWKVELPHVEKPEVVPPTPPAPGSPTRRVLHLSDVHLDLSYTVGANAACDLPNCCMNSTLMADNQDTEAQYWGDLRCDVPVWTFRHLLEHIKETHSDEFEYIMLTGDFPAHDVWLQSREANLMHTKMVVDLVKEYFPDTPVFPSVGNHESFPCNSYPTSNVEGENNPGWLYSNLAEFYSGWLPDQALEQFRIDGFYSLDYWDDFKIIGINSNMCLTYNFFLFLEWQDPGAELAWLVEELLAAEIQGKKVHLISHVPPGNSDCLGGWGREFSKIINRFEGTVVAQFYGHTHNDEFVVFYDEVDRSRAVNVAFVTPSVTTFTGLNPGYRVYTMDAGYEGASYRVLDSDTFIFNMTAANLAGPEAKPEWFKLYSTKQDLEMESLLPQEWDKLVRRLESDEELYAKFNRFFNKDSYGEIQKKHETLCPLITTSFLDKSKCEEILGPAPSRLTVY